MNRRDKMELPFLSIREVSELIKRKEVSPVELTQSILDRIEGVDSKIQAYITILGEEALRVSKEAEKQISSGTYLGALHGVPISVKDIFVMKGTRTTCGSKILENFVSPYDAMVVEKLKHSGAIIVGLKPTYGRVSRFGMIAFASSLDQGGPLTKTVEDAALMLNVIAGGDARDSTSVHIPVPDYAMQLDGEIKGIRVGVPKEYFIKGIDVEVEEAVEYAVSTYYLIAPSEASSNLARYDGVRYGFRVPDSNSLREIYHRTRAEGFGAEVKRRIMIGTYALSAGYYDAYYLKAQRVRTLIKRDFEEAFKKVDIIITPTSPEAAFKIGEKTDDPLKMYLSDIFTIPCNLAGLPGISAPCGFTSGGLPIGLQFLGRPFDEETILRVAHAYELRTNWRGRRPPI